MEESKTDYMMDKAVKKLLEIHTVTKWLIDHAQYIPGPTEIYKKVGENFIPYDIKMMLLELVRCDFANAITPTVMWRDISAAEGAPISDDEVTAGVNE